MILESVYPVGSVYISLTDSRNPADILGFGTWEALPAGYGLVAQGTATAEDGSTLTFTAGQKSGEFKHQITVGELPFNKRIATDDAWHPVWGNDENVQSLGLAKKQHITQTPFSIMGPQVGAYIWKRIT